MPTYFELAQKELKWHKFYLRLAKKFACLSKDPKYKIGAVIVTEEGILYPGYNGDEIGGTNERDSMQTFKSGFIHAEANCILKFNPSVHKNCKFYLSHSPCVVCARMMVNTRSINQVYYAEKYSEDLSGIDILEKHGIMCERIKI